MSEKIKHYTNGEVTIVWQPDSCIHAGICVRGLPEVFHPKERPWIKIESATTARLIEQIKQCPSGALSYFMNDASDKSSEEPLVTRIEVLKNGPLLVYGTLKVKEKDGNETIKSKTTAFCRCGASANKPYCDGAHTAANFRDE